ncbi:MAG: DNA repair protein RecO [Deltaproteobacteria bacterium]|nr:DNA repair protein RecO [Deltaproteobacteria bacterium]
MKRGYRRTDAVILNSMDYGESDRIITFYTRDYGKLKGIAKGARRSKKRFVGNLEPASRVRLVFFQTGKSELVRVEAIALQEGYSLLKNDIERYGRACYVLELTNELTLEGMKNAEFFDTLSCFLRLPGDGGGGFGREMLRFFEIKALALSGYLPHLEGCVACKAGPGQRALFFSSEKGGVICGKCAAFLKNIIPLSAGAAGFLSMAARLEVEKLKRLMPGPIVLDECERILADFIRYQLGKELKSKKFMEKMGASRIEWQFP